jgi:recombination protein RecA
MTEIQRLEASSSPAQRPSSAELLETLRAANPRCAPALQRASQVLELARASTAPRWGWSETAGRLCELAGARAGATLSFAASLVLDAQRRGESVAWIQPRSSSFFPPDLAECGVDLDALVVVRPPQPSDLGLAAEWIARSGAFGLIVLDVTALAFVPMAMQSRLLSLAQKHDLGLVCLTEKAPERASLSSLIGLRADTLVRRRGNSANSVRDALEPLDPRDVLATFECELSAAKDKRRSRPWRHSEARRGTPGLR